MPLYDYTCGSCGPFRVLRPLAEFEQPAKCPRCESESPKALCFPAYHGASQRQRTYDGIANPSQNVPKSGAIQVVRHGVECPCCSKASSVQQNA